jgi:RNA polymerase sigma-70 factor (ECF subfamily)
MMSTQSPESAVSTTSLAMARAQRFCVRQGAGLVDHERAEALLRARSEDLDQLSAVELEAACQDAVSELLVRRIQAGEGDRHACTERLLELWLGDVTRWCRWLCHRSQPADDIAQDVLLVLFTDLRRVREPAQLRRWLHSVAWRKVRAHRRLAWFRLRSSTEPTEQRLSVQGDERPERLERVAQALDELSLEQRRLLWLVYVEGWPRKEAAALVGLAEGTFNRRLTRARRDFTAAAAVLGVKLEDDTNPGGAR